MNTKEILSGFENRTLPNSKWTHEAHLIVSLWYCSMYDQETTLKLLREKIKLFNEAVCRPNTDNGGYHETLTRFWIWQTYQFLAECKLYDFSENCSAFIASDLGSKDAAFRYYSRELLFSTEARQKWIEPDLASMKTRSRRYMIIERFHPNKVNEIYSRFAEKGRMLPDGVNYIDSWIDEDVTRCFQLMESDGIEKIEEWIGHWNDLTDFEIVPVRSSLEAKRKVFLPNKNPNLKLS